MSIHLQREIDKLQRDLLLICSIVEEQVQKAMRALFDRDPELAREVQAMDEDVDRREINLEEECLKTLALHQPVAINLRQLIAALKINNDLERIGDMAVNVARKAAVLVGERAVEIPADFAVMGEQTQAMLRRSLDALVQMDAALARDVCACDDEVDQLKRKIRNRIEGQIRQDPERIGSMLRLLSVSRNLERIADCAVNIAEDVIYMVDGRIGEAPGRLSEGMRKRRLFWQLYPATLLIALAALTVVALDASFFLIASLLTAVLLAIASLIVARRFVKPLEQLSFDAAWFARGDLAHRVSTVNAEEIGGLAETLNQMAADLEDKLTTVVRQRNERDAILSSMVEGVLAIDSDQRLLRMNDAAARLLGVEAARAEGRSLPEIVRNIDLHKLVAAVISRQQPAEGDVVLRDHEPRFLHVHGTVLPEAPEGRSGVLLVIHDVTGLKRLESVRRDFVANVSHELKTPVTSIQGYVETLLDGAMNDAQQREKFLKIVAKQTERLHVILEDLLTLARVEQEGEKPQNAFAQGSLRGVLEAAVADCGAKAEEKHMQVQLTCPAELTASISASLLEQAVVNLIENAIAYSPPGRAVEVAGLAGEREIEIRVRDRGCGISREHLPRIFERFYRVDKSRSRDSGGTGLGLAIVKHIVQLHGGRTAVESVPGEGSTFSIFLPKGSIDV